MSIHRAYILLALVVLAFAGREGAAWYRETKMPSGAYVEIFGNLMVLPSGYTLSLASRTNKDGLLFVPHHLKQGKVLAGPYSGLPSTFLDWVTKSTTETKERCGVHVLDLKDQGATATLVHDSKEYILFSGVPAKDIEFSLAAFCRVGRKT